MPDRDVHHVVWPLGRSRIDVVEAGNPLSGLEGKSIGFIWDDVFHGDVMFDVIRDRLRQETGGHVTFVGHEMFGNVHGPDEVAVIKALPAKLQEAQVDGVVVGVGA